MDQTAPTTPDLLDRARALLGANDTGSFIKPSRTQYPHQWNWDAAFIAIGLSHLDPERGRQEVRALLRGQWRDGMLPHILYPDGPSGYFPTPDFWRVHESPHAPAFPTSGLTQPPVLATAVRLLHERAHDERASLAFVAEVYPALLAWHRWLRSARDPEGTGLVAIIHPWEAGTDNSPRFDAALARLGPVDPPPYERADRRHVAPGERPRALDYDRFMHLIGAYRDLAWEPAAIWERAPFLVRDVLFNAVLHRADQDLRALAALLGEDTAEPDRWLAATATAFEALWDEESGLYLDFDMRAGEPLRENTFATFVPLYAGLPSRTRAERLVREQLQDPRRYAPGGGTRYALPTTAKDCPRFEPRRYWRGPIWLSANWLVIRGLERYGLTASAEALRKDSLELVRRSGFVEYYDPRDGTSCGARGFSWSAALAVDLLMDD